MKTSLFTILSLCLLTSGAAFAGGHGKGKFREARKNGEITKEESETLKAERNDLQEARKAAKADGKVTGEERAQLKEKRAALKKHAQELATNNVKSEPRKKRGEGAKTEEPAKQ